MLEFQIPSGRAYKPTFFIELLLPLAIRGTYTYRVPADRVEEVAIGKRAIVPFGKSKIYAGIIVDIHQQAPERYDAKYLLDILDDEPIVTPLQLRLWSWIADYYVCTPGEVMQAALPSALKLASETRIILRVDGPDERHTLSDKEFLILEALDVASELKISDIVKLLGQKRVFPLIKRLLDKQYIQVSEEIKDRYRPKLKTFVHLNPEYKDATAKQALFEQLNRAPKQLDALLSYYVLAKQNQPIAKDALLEHSGCGPSAFRALVDKDIFQIEEKAISRFTHNDADDIKDFTLSAAQEKALNDIDHAFIAKDVVLLYGVTASGKTQLYMKCIQRALDTGKSALYLLPEIALTSQMVERLKIYFGDAIGIYHSRLNEQERAEVWKNVLQGKTKVVLGARSAIFLPFQALGFVVVDEEHETSYKQFDPAPRYHARDTAIYLAHLFEAKVLLGSATPSLESYYNARAGKYGFVELKQRYGEAQLPEIEVVSLKENHLRKDAHPIFTTALIEAIERALMQKEQVILFQNRRGHTPFLLCQTCGYSPKCIHCDVSLTFHKSTGKLHCHYCGFKEDVLTVCPACGSTHIQSKGFGTERIEEELAVLFPEARLARLDLDSTRSRYSFERILHDFDEHRFDILIGTQMVAKGLDFGKVSLIGIINADNMINFPDFRAFERSFALFSQVSGRAGRRDRIGKVLIQAYATQHRILEQVKRHDYKGMFDTEIEERKSYAYPPFFRLIQIDVKHKKAELVPVLADHLGRLLRARFGDRVLGPEQPLVSKIRTYYIQTLMLKIELKHESTAKAKSVLKEIIAQFNSDKATKGTLLTIDVDPY